jgi:filamentous hemagglutinin family protein
MATSALAIGVALGGAADAGALPTGGAVAQGTAAIGPPGPGQLTINQSSAKAVINWSDFSIGAGNSVQFNNGAGATLNRVTGPLGSQINGSLLGTGSVYLVNPNGVVVGPTGVVKTGGSFVATTLGISDAAFMAGDALTFSGASGASVINLGQVGALGGDVVLAAQTVENDGTITAPSGDVGLLGGSQVILNDTLQSNGKFQVVLGADASVTNTGAISGALAELRAYDGNVYALAGNTGGAITATGVGTSDGKVFLVAGPVLPVGSIDLGDVIIDGSVSFSGGANTLIIRASNQAIIGSPITTAGGHITLDAQMYDFALGPNGFTGSLSFTGGSESGESLIIDNQVYTLLYSIADVQNIQNNLAGHYALASDIAASATTSWNNGTGFRPIGYAAPLVGYQSNEVFTGFLEGDGHSINNLYINNAQSIGQGLINVSTGFVRDIGIKNANISDSLVGGSAATLVVGNYGTVHNDYATGAITGGTSAGGLVANNYGSIYDSFADVAIVGSTYGGGLVGINGSAISSSYATGAVKSTDGYSGGLVGQNAGAIQDSYATGATQNLGMLVQRGSGGLVGYNETSGQISDSYATGAADGVGDLGGLVADNVGIISASYASGAVGSEIASGAIAAPPGSDMVAVGGLVGDNMAAGQIHMSYASGAVSGPTDAAIGGLTGLNTGWIVQTYASGAVGANGGPDGGLIGNNAGTVTSSYWDTQTSGQATSAGGVGLTTAQFANTANFAGFTFTKTPGGAGWVIVDQNGSLNNDGEAAGATRPLLASEYSTTITNTHQMQLIAMDLSADYTLANDLTFLLFQTNGPWITSEGFSPVGGFNGGEFTGAFNGAGHTISNLAVNAAAAGLEHAGLFGVIGNGGAVTDLTLAGAYIQGTTNVGALAGRVYAADITDVTISGQSVSGTTSVGGLAGYLNGGTLDADSASLTVKGTGVQIGGLVGYDNNGAITNSHASSVVEGGSWVGGLIGWATSGTVANDTAGGPGQDVYGA